MTQRYRVVGGCAVAGVVNGAEITQEALDEVGVNVPALVYAGHLEPVSAPPEPKSKPTPKRRGGGDE